MDIIYVILLVFMTGSFCIISFLVGILSTINKNKINLNPIKAYKEYKDTKKQEQEANLEQRQIATMLENINIYDGTPIGQRDIPNE